LDAVRAFYRLHCQTRRRHGMPSQPFCFFENIHRHILKENQGQIVLATQGQVPAAGAVFFHSGRTAIFKFGASAKPLRMLRPNNLVMWEAIKWYARRGFSTLDFGRTSLSNDGLRRYKLGWGTQERRIDYVRYNCQTGSFVTGRDEVFGWHNRLFKILPVAFGRLIGAALYRHAA
jgi:hypothetical protein